MQKLKDRINLTSKEDFDELSQRPLNPAEMEESMIGLATELTPTKGDINENKNKRFTYDKESGDKVRLKGNNPRKSGNSRVERKQERSQAFWDRLWVALLINLI